MKIRVAVTSSDGRTVDQHFGRCSSFSIAELDSDSGVWEMLESRETEQVCHDFSHREEQVAETVGLLSDCGFLLTYRIGIYPYSLFQSRGITCFETPSEEPETVGAALKNLQKYLAVRRPFSGDGSVSGAGTEKTERKGIYFE